MITKKEFLEKFSDKQKLDIANEYLAIFFDSYIDDSNWRIRMAKSENNIQALHDSILNIATQRIK